MKSLTHARASDWAPYLLLVLTVVAVYLPASDAGYIWDDDDYVLRNDTLRDADGLRRIWLDVFSIPQYYPLVHTTFWVEFQLWGLQPSGYHIVNILLHAGVAVALLRLLRRLEVPAPWLCAALFALHPVQVESVAWITERKNVLSGVFYLLAALKYLSFLQVRGDLAASGDSAAQTPVGPTWRYYSLAVVFYFCALLSKTVTCSLPAAVLLVVWWKTGRITRRQILPLLPMFAIGVGMGLLTAWIERVHVHAEGEEFSWSFLQRCFIAGHALWFYAGKLLLPVDLSFFYDTHWNLDPTDWQPYLYPLAALGVIGLLWNRRRKWGRGPLIGVLYFAGTLVPALGFVNIAPLRFSLVADHFQYLASIGLLTLAGVGLARGWQWLMDTELTRQPSLRHAPAALLLVVLAGMTWVRCHAYENAETLYRDTINKNPTAVVAHNNLGFLLEKRGDLRESIPHFEAAIREKPDYMQPRRSLCRVMLKLDRTDHALEIARSVVEKDPGHWKSHHLLGKVYEVRQEYQQSRESYGRALERWQENADVHFDLGVVCRELEEWDAATQHFRRAKRYNPQDDLARLNLGITLAKTGQLDEAVREFRDALEVNSRNPWTFYNLGLALERQGEKQAAVECLARAAQLAPDATPIVNQFRRMQVSLRTGDSGETPNSG